MPAEEPDAGVGVAFGCAVAFGVAVAFGAAVGFEAGGEFVDCGPNDCVGEGRSEAAVGALTGFALHAVAARDMATARVRKVVRVLMSSLSHARLPAAAPHPWSRCGSSRGAGRSHYRAAPPGGEAQYPA